MRKILLTLGFVAFLFFVGSVTAIAYDSISYIRGVSIAFISILAMRLCTRVYSVFY